MKYFWNTTSIFVVAQVVAAGFAMGQVLSHGPVVGGVTASQANVFVRTDQATSVALDYGTDPNLATYQVSDTLSTDSTGDFTRIIPLANLTAETTYYLNVVVNGTPRLSPPYPSFTTFPPSGTSRDFNFIVLTDFEAVKNLRESVQTFASAAAANPVFAFIGGDFDHRNPQTLDKKRQMYKDLYNRNTPFMGDFVNLILRKTAIIHQWDDHDSGLNNLDRTYLNWNLNQQVYQEYMPSYPCRRSRRAFGRNSATLKLTVLCSTAAASGTPKLTGTTPVRACLTGTHSARPANCNGWKIASWHRRPVGRLCFLP